MNTIDVKILKTARELLANGWSQGHSARTANKMPSNPLHPAACSFCWTGAIYAASARHDGTEWEPHLSTKSADFLHKWPAEWNDDPRRTHKSVLKKFDAFIKWYQKVEEESHE